jgi:hypothetical protein
VQAALLRQLRQFAADALQDLLGAAHQHHHGELAAQVDHAAVLDVAAALEDELGDFIDQPRPVMADGAENGVWAHGAPSSVADVIISVSLVTCPWSFVICSLLLVICSDP